jgi:uncharacterized protein (DUF697 family)
MNDEAKFDIGDARPFSPAVKHAVTRMGQCREEARGIVKSYSIGAMSIGMIPVPMIDLIALTNVQWNLICRLADHYGVPMKGSYRTMVTAIVSGGLPVLFAGAGSSVLKLVPGFGPLAGTAALSSLAGVITHATGKIFLDHFEKGGTMDNYCPEAFKRQLRLELLARGRQDEGRVEGGAAA